MTENSYAATATAEKRLREVLTARFGDSADAMADILLGDAEIEYLPRKKSVSIRLVVPETASTTSKPSVTVGAESVADRARTAVAEMHEGAAQLKEALASVKDDTPVLGVTTVGDVRSAVSADLPHDRGVGPARIGTFEVKSGETAPIYEDDFFTE